MNLRDGWLDIVDQIDGPTKTVASVRAVPIHPRLLKLLKALPKHEHKLFFAAEWREQGKKVELKVNAVGEILSRKVKSPDADPEGGC